MKTHSSIQGDMVDQICHDHYGSTSMLETVYDANPGLAQLGAVLPTGTIVNLPDEPAPQPRSTIRLWGE